MKSVSDISTVETKYLPEYKIRMKSGADNDLEQLSRHFLYEEDILCRYNSHRELEVKVTYQGKTRIYNLTFILKSHPEFANICLNAKEIELYELFILNHSTMKPKIDGIIPTASDYMKKDIKNKHTQLLLGEKFAITIYTMIYYKGINSFLRENGKDLRKLSPEVLTKSVKEILLTSVIASRALSYELTDKNENSQKTTPVSFLKLFRYEKTVEKLNNQRIQNSTFVNYQFTSLSRSAEQAISLFENEKNLTKLTILFATSSKIGIDQLSAHSEEYEVILPPNSFFMKTDYKIKDGLPCFKYTYVSPTVIPNQEEYSSEINFLDNELLDFTESLDYDTVKNTSLGYFITLRNTFLKKGERLQRKLDELIELKLLIDKYDDLLSVVEYVYHTYFKHPYQDRNKYKEDVSLYTKYGVINRPNHNIINAIRTSLLVSYVVDFWMERHWGEAEAISQSLKNSFTEMMKIHVAILFYTTGRGSEVSWRTHLDVVMAYKDICAGNYKNYMSGKINDEEMNRFMSILKGEKSEEVKFKVLEEVVKVCHSLDLLRCYDKDDFKNSLPSFIDLKLVELAKRMIEATGDRMCSSIEEEIIDCSIPYDVEIFYKASTNPKYCLIKCLQCMAKFNVEQKLKKQNNISDFSFELIDEESLMLQLFNSVKANHIFMVKEIMEIVNARGIFSNKNVETQLSLLKLSIQLEHIEIFDLLRKTIVCDDKIINQEKFLHLAIENNSKQYIIKSLLEQKANLFEKNDSNHIPLAVAVKNKKEAIIELMVFERDQIISNIDTLYAEKGLDQYYRDSILCYLATKKNNLEVLKHLLNLIELPIQKRIPLIYNAVLFNNESILKFLLQLDLAKFSYSHSEPLYLALKNGYKNLVTLLINSGWNGGGEYGIKKLLFEAVKYNNLVTVALLFEYQLIPKVIFNEVKNRIILLQFAIDHQNTEIVNYFIHYNISLPLKEKSSTNVPLFLYALQKGDMKMTKLLLEHDENISLFDFVTSNVTAEMLECLLKEKIYDLNICNELGHNILHKAILNKKIFLNVLLKYGADPFGDLLSEQKFNILRFASEKNKTTMGVLLEFMIKSKTIKDVIDHSFIDFNINNKTDKQFLWDFMNAVLEINNLEIFKQLFISFPINEIKKLYQNNHSLLILAAQCGRYEICDFFVKNNYFDLNKESHQGLTPIKAAVISQDIKLIEFFLRHHCDPQSALYIAVKSGTLDPLKALVKKCIELNVVEVTDLNLSEVLLDRLRSNLNADKWSLEVEKIIIFMLAGIKVDLQGYDFDAYYELLEACAQSKNGETLCYLLMIQPAKTLAHVNVLELINTNSHLIATSLITILKNSKQKDFYLKEIFNHPYFDFLLKQPFDQSFCHATFHSNMTILGKLQDEFPELAHTSNSLKFEK